MVAGEMEVRAQLLTQLPPQRRQRSGRKWIIVFKQVFPVFLDVC